VEKSGLSEISAMIIHSKEQTVIRMGMEHCNEKAQDVYICIFGGKRKSNCDVAS
jgi:hypothetical protein